MKILLNAKDHVHAGDGTVRSLLAEIGADPERVAIVINESVVPRTDWDSARLASGNRVEVLTYAGGG